MPQPALKRTSDAATPHPRRSRLAEMCTWPTVAAISTATAWVLGLGLAQLLLGIPPSATATAFKFVTASVLGDSFPVIQGSVLLWASIGFGVGGLVFISRQSDGNEPPKDSVRSLTWATAAGLCAGAVWAIGQAVSAVALHSDSFGDDLASRFASAALEMAGIGAATGLVVGLVSGLKLLKHLIGEPSARTWVLWTAGCAMVAGLGGALSVVAVVVTAAVLPPLVASSFAIAFAGFVGGLLAAEWSWRVAVRKPVSDVELDDEPLPATPDEPSRPSPRADVRVRRRPKRSAILRFVPALAVSIAALMIAAVVAPALAAVPIALIGLLGLSLVPIVWNQERRLAAIEARFRVEREI